MNTKINSFTLIIFMGMISSTWAGIYAPAAGQPGSTAIYKDDASFVEWATGCTVTRGPMNITDASKGYASFGTEANATGKATGDSYGVVSLGDGGSAVLSFDKAICNGEGYDFAVFENGFNDTFLELGFVEVSSDGVNFFRFNNVSQTQTTTQVGGFGSVDCTNLNNLAGKYRQGYGTPFDLSELATVSPLLDVNNVKYVRIVDVIGCIQDGYCTYDSLGNKINDPWSTPFASSGFDLDAIGVMNEIPEPATVALLTMGVLGLGGKRRKI
jgi:hypothetical protein